MIKLFGLGAKKPEEISFGKGFIPIDRVRELSEKGFSEPEIIDVLRKEGFSAEEIDRALTQALEVKVSGAPEEKIGLPTGEAFRPKPEAPRIPEPSLEYPQVPTYSTEELVESIVQERMADVDQYLAEFSTKQAELERSISNLSNLISSMSREEMQARQILLSKIDSLKDSLTDIDARLSGLEKAFKDALPALIESVRSLTDLVQRLKRESK